MLSQTQSSLPQAYDFERYPKWRTDPNPRDFEFSQHDNKHALKDDVIVFHYDVGRRRYPEKRQHKSHLCLCHFGVDRSAEQARKNLSATKSDFVAPAAVDVPTDTRRFPRNHQEKSAKAASLAQADEPFMWFGQFSSDPSEGAREQQPAATSLNPQRVVIKGEVAYRPGPNFQLESHLNYLLI